MWNCTRDGHLWTDSDECIECGESWSNPNGRLTQARSAFLAGTIDADDFEFHAEHALRGHSDGCLCWDCVPPGGGRKKPWSTVVSGPLLF